MPTTARREAENLPIRFVGMTEERALAIADAALDKMGGPRGQLPKKQSEALNAEITRLNALGLNDQQIAGRTGVGRTTIRTRREGLSLPSNTPTRERDPK